MPSEMYISNEELTRRLKAHNYNAPPVTASTRSVLLKKLESLDAEKKQRNKVVRGGNPTNGNGSTTRTHLLDYSSGEEDFPAPSGVRRRTSNTYRAQALNTPSKSTQSSLSVGHIAPKLNGHSSQHSVGSRLINYSEAEDDDDDFEDEDDVCDEDDDDDDGDDDIEDEDEEEEEEDEEVSFRDLAIQTSQSLDDSTALNGVDSPRDNGRSYGSRFKSSTPIPFIKATSSYLTPPNSASRNPTTPSNLTATSPLRRAIAKNEKAFGSLGEALDSIPRSPAPTMAVTSSSPVTTSKIDIKLAPPATMRESKSEYLSKNSGFCNSHFISKLIIGVVVLFFLSLFYKYSTLRPNIDIRPRLKICSKDEIEKGSCVDPDQIDEASVLFKELVDFLDSARTCPSSEGVGFEVSGKGSLTDIKKALFADFHGDADTEEPSEEAPSSGTEILMKLVRLLELNPDLGIKVEASPENGTELSLFQPRIQWGCWIIDKLEQTYEYGALILWWCLTLGSLAVAGYVGYRIYVWQQERILREKQDIFELVEQVLSLLVGQHQAAMRGINVARPFLAINHIRDQLIPPQDRKRKKKLWEKVEKYIRESESRVREELQVIFGEENRVWRWIPDLSWGTPLNPNGPNPYVSPTSSPQQFSPSFLTSPGVPHTMNVSTSPSWQGSAFTSLNKNVAAPAVAPTSCLKVRHMFDRQAIVERNRRGGSTTAWVWQVKDEILQRCSSGLNPALILHIAVDTESSEGCVYIKCKTTDEAAKVFSALHGQWYSGNLVTVKYMREERYHERFPDSKHQSNPLRPAPPKLKPV